MKDKFINEWLYELKNNYKPEKFTYQMSTTNSKTGMPRTFRIEWKNDKHVQLINSDGGRCNTLSIDTIRRIFNDYNGIGDINYHKAGLYSYFNHLIPSLYTDYRFKELSNITEELSNITDVETPVTPNFTFSKEDLERAKGLLEITDTDGKPYFHKDFIMNTVLNIPLEYIEYNKEFWHNDRSVNRTSEFEF